MSDRQQVAPRTASTRTASMRLAVVALGIVVMAFTAGCGGAGEQRTASVEGTSTQRRSDSRSATSRETVPDATTEASEVPAPSTSPSTPPPPTAPPAATLTVTRVVDGDTIWVSDGSKIRLIGIDTPEQGECGYGESGDLLRALVGGKQVVLVAGARDDADRYGRLLRYVEVDGVDANLEMIRSGRAVARYDSRDGYGRHAREDVYIAADAASPNANVCGPPTTLAPSPPAAAPAPPAAAPASGSGGGGTDPRHPTCASAKAAGLGPYRIGIDPEYSWYRDADGDGIVCE